MNHHIINSLARLSSFLRPADVAAACVAAGLILTSASAVAQEGGDDPAASGSGEIPESPRVLIPETNPVPLPELQEHLHALSVEGRPDIPLLLMPDDAIPITEVTFAFRGGVELEPADRAGLAVLYTDMLRRGGAGDRTPEAVEALLADSACRLNTFVGARLTGVTIDCLASELDRGLSLLEDVVFQPAFDGGVLAENKQQMMRSIGQRNANPTGVARIHMNRIAYGEDHPAAQEMTQATITNITADDVRRYHETIARPERLVIAVRGDFDPSDVRLRLSSMLRGWPEWTSEPYELGPRSQRLAPGLYHLPLGQPGLPQALGIMANRSVPQHHPDAPLLELASQILGGGEQNSRMSRAIAAAIGPQANVNLTAFVQNEPKEPGLFGAFYQAPTGSALRVGELVLNEYAAIAEGASPITELELETARTVLRDAMRRQFISASQRLSEMLQAVVLDYPEDPWAARLERIESATRTDVARAIAEHVTGDPGALLVAGDWSGISASESAEPEALAERLGGTVVALPMLDPMTLEPMERPGPAAPGMPTP